MCRSVEDTCQQSVFTLVQGMPGESSGVRPYADLQVRSVRFLRLDCGQCMPTLYEARHVDCQGSPAASSLQSKNHFEKQLKYTSSW